VARAFLQSKENAPQADFKSRSIININSTYLTIEWGKVDRPPTRPLGYLLQKERIIPSKVPAFRSQLHSQSILLPNPQISHEVVEDLLQNIPLSSIPAQTDGFRRFGRTD
jgi:hypothetical protein